MFNSQTMTEMYSKGSSSKPCFTKAMEGYTSLVEQNKRLTSGQLVLHRVDKNAL